MFASDLKYNVSGILITILMIIKPSVQKTNILIFVFPK